jgi:molecular chaperone DnaJ
MDAQPSVRPAAQEQAGSQPPASFQKLMDEFFSKPAEPAEPAEPAGPQPRSGRSHETDVVLTGAQARDGVVTLTMQWPTLCGPCRGTGVAGGAHQGTTCTACTGSGLTGAQEQRTLKVRLPAGIADGQRIRLAGRAHPSPDPGGPAGDLYVRVFVDPHQRFETRGDDYLYTLDVTKEQARSGAVVTVPTAGGTVQLRLPKDVPDGRTMRLRGKGARPGGALLITIRIR